MFTAALVLSVATNVGLLFYILANHILDKMEKIDAPPSTYRSRINKPATHLPRPSSQQE